MSTDTLFQIRELEAQIQQLRGRQLAELQEKLRGARQTVACLESEIAKITGGKAPPVGTNIIRRERTSSAEIRGLVLKSLASTSTGMSQREIADETGLNYNTVGLFLKKNPKDFKTTGTPRSKRYFLK